MRTTVQVGSRYEIEFTNMEIVSVELGQTLHTPSIENGDLAAGLIDKARSA